MLEIILATNNAKKIEELTALLRGLTIGIRLPGSLTPVPCPDETGCTFVENARIKARAFVAASGIPALADDSGLEVDHLSGRPGVFSSRFAGDDCTDADNNRKLLEMMRGVPQPKRTARFRCVLVLGFPDREEIVTEGSVEGIIAEQERGGEGFGYDPLFLVPSESQTFAELGAAFKQKHSHRSVALARMKEKIKALIERPEIGERA